MIGTAAMPITALSAKLMTINRKSRATISQPCVGTAAGMETGGMPASAEREVWTFMTTSEKNRYPAVPIYGTVRYRVNMILQRMRQQSVIADSAVAETPMRRRILGAAFEAFVEEGYAGTSTLDIATRAKVSKRDLYAHFGSKQDMLVACIKSRAERMRLLPDLPAPRTRQMLAATLTAFGRN